MRLLLLLITLSFNLFAQEIPEWQKIPIREDLYNYRQNEVLLGLDFNELNKNLLQSINNYKPTYNDKRASGVSYQQALKFMRELETEGIFINESTQYDEEKNLGLCFGRAIYFHLLMLKYGVNKDSIKKIFALGPMSSGVSNLTWQFHVATMVKDSDTNDWWVLDTNFNKPLTAEDWMFQMKRRSQDKIFRFLRPTVIDKSKSLRFYITEAQKIGPSGWEYNIKPFGLFDPFYNHYFQDMFKVLKNKNIPKNTKINYIAPSLCKSLF